MTIIKKLTHTLSITLIMLAMASSHQLHAMDSEKVKLSDKITMDKDFQAYKLLSFLDNDHEWHLPLDLVQIIAINVSKLIDKNCYEELANYSFLLFDFMKDKQHASIPLASIANSIKRYLRHDNKSLEIKKFAGHQTVFHVLANIGAYIPSRYNGPHTQVEWIKIFCLVVESKAWDIICIKDSDDNTPLHYYYDSIDMIDTLLSNAPSPQEAWNLIMIPNKDGHTALANTINKGWRSSARFLESYRPKEQ